MPRKGQTYSLPEGTLAQCAPGQVLTSKWQNTTFSDIYDGFNKNTIPRDINDTSVFNGTFDAGSQIIRTTGTGGQTGNLKIKANLTPGNIPQGGVYYHDPRYGKTPEFTIKSNHLALDDNTNIALICQNN